MEKLPICRICLDSNVQHVLVDPQLQDLYQRITKIPFQTSDVRPQALCYICHGQLIAAQRLMLKCLKAEEIFTEMLNRVTEEDDVQKAFSVDRSALQGLSYTINPVVVDDTCAKTDIIVKEEEFKIYDTNIELEEVMQEIVDSIDFKLDNEQNMSDLKDGPPSYDVKDIGEMTREQTEEVDGGRNERRLRRAARVAKTPKIKMSKKFKPGLNGSDNNNTSTHAPEISSRTDKKIRCNKCNRHFKEKCYLIAHTCKQTFHPYSCGVCDKIFTAKHKLATHSVIHTTEKSHACNVCDKRFRTKHYLRLHSRTHTGAKPCVCNVCNKGFSTASGLSTHSRTHTGDRPYVCKVCDKRFVVHGHVARHARIHTGERPYVCDICHKSFSQNCSMMNHVRCMHAEKR